MLVFRFQFSAAVHATISVFRSCSRINFSFPRLFTQQFQFSKAVHVTISVFQGCSGNNFSFRRLFTQQFQFSKVVHATISVSRAVHGTISASRSCSLKNFSFLMLFTWQFLLPEVVCVTIMFSFPRLFTLQFQFHLKNRFTYKVGLRKIILSQRDRYRYVISFSYGHIGSLRVPKRKKSRICICPFENIYIQKNVIHSRCIVVHYLITHAYMHIITVTYNLKICVCFINLLRLCAS